MDIGTQRALIAAASIGKPGEDGKTHQAPTKPNGQKKKSTDQVAKAYSYPWDS